MSESRIRIHVEQNRAVQALDAMLGEAAARGEHNVTVATLEAVRERMGELCVERILRRLVAQGRLLRPSARVAHWVIVPPECQAGAVVAPELWIDAYFAGTLGVGYCVGLSTAAACYGAAAPTPRLAHLMVQRSRAAFALGAFECRFHAQPNLAAVPTRWQVNATGRYRISAPEMTALDLAKRQARRAAGCDLKQVIERLLEQCSEAGMRQALDAARNGDAAERLAEIARQCAPHLSAVIRGWLPGAESPWRPPHAISPG